MKMLPDTGAASTLRRHAPAANTAAVITMTGAAEEIHVVDHISWSYNDDPTGGSLTIAVGGTTVFSVAITSGGPGFFAFPNGAMKGTPGQTVVITLAAGGEDVSGVVNAITR